MGFWQEGDSGGQKGEREGVFHVTVDAEDIFDCYDGASAACRLIWLVCTHGLDAGHVSSHRNLQLSHAGRRRELVLSPPTKRLLMMKARLARLDTQSMNPTWRA